LYLCMFTVLLGYRWQTRQYYLNQAAKAAQRETLEGQEEKAPNVKTVVQKTRKKSPLKQHEETIQSLTEDLVSAQHSLQAKLEKIHGYQETLETIQQSDVWTQDFTMEHKAAADNFPLDHWKQLMSFESLQEIPDVELESIFGSAAREIEAVVNESPSSVNWKVVEELLFNGNSQIDKKPSELQCPGVKEFRRAQVKNIKNAAYESDLVERMTVFDELLSKRTHGEGFFALSPESRNELEGETETRLNMIMEQIVIFVTDLDRKMSEKEMNNVSEESDLDSDCVDIEFVTALVDAGLKALSVNDDVRDTLRKKTLQFHPQISEDELILDADLPLLSPTKDLVTTVNLRSAIDSPLLNEAVGWIDRLVDLVGGYNDKLDQYLDHLTNTHQSNSVGEVVVEQLLQWAGLVTLDTKKLNASPSFRRKLVEKLR